ncbi:Hypothetical predicted protein [Olea europaea subsp. europaea]|uniref:Sialate O-acetylesterase domain-containing protein n=1 Tax=Olea europaea subsp. europaea TaxID=158383 RepID=A0A8S0R5I7_OLEEU|nr:Hypothetical predicted protein [Olea europaea subsp. europaea]
MRLRLNCSRMNLSNSNPERWNLCQNVNLHTRRPEQHGRPRRNYQQCGSVDNTPDPSKVFQLNAQLKWEVARDPLHNGIDIGVIGLVPCARGDLSIKEWEKGKEHYNTMIQRVKAAVEVGGGEIKAFLWYQAKSDTYNLKDAESYKGLLEKLFQNVQTDLNMPSLPILLVIIES